MARWERTGSDDAPVWRLEWPHRPGLVVRCTVPSLRGRSLAARVGPLLAAGLDPDYRLMLGLAEVFGEDSLLSWNVKWGGRVVPATADGMARLDLTLVAEILSTWVAAWSPPDDESDSDPDMDPDLLAELDALSVDITDSPATGEDTDLRGLVTADA